MQSKRIPQIRPLTDLRVSMNEITAYIDQEKSPVILTKHGHGKYVFMRLEEYNALAARYELYEHVQEGIADVRAGRTLPFDAFMEGLRKDMRDGNL